MRTAGIWASILLGVMLAAGALAESLDRPLRLGYAEPASPPYQLAHDRNPPGISFDILNEVVNRLGLSVEYVRWPNKRVLFELGKGRLDGAFIYSWKPDREALAVYPMKAEQPDHALRMATLTYYFYSLKVNRFSWHGQRFEGLTLPIGANQGYSVADDLREAGYEVLEARDTAYLFRLLREGRIALAAHQSVVVDAWSRLAGDDLKDIERLSLPISTKDYFLLFSHDFMQRQEKLARRIWQTIGEVRDPVTEAVRGRYGQ
ncbi:MAG: hypothetical protein D6758_05430 [Gammaproteobacteria bacterium]|nr:MAG: hypothetical protein D6758_05430 [Gammaproteobacteria bacterium]